MPRATIRNRLLDVRPDRLDLRDRAYRPPLVSLPPEYPDPDVVRDLLPRYEYLILDQGEEGACTGFGLAAIVNYLFWRRLLANEAREQGLRGTKAVKAVKALEAPEAPKLEQVSPRMLYHLARMYDEWPGENYDGSSCRGAIKGWHHHGVCTEKLWPYRDRAKKVRFIKPKDGWTHDAATRTLGAYYRIDKNSVADMQAAIREVGGIYVSAEVHAGWMLGATPKNLAYIGAPKGEKGGHSFAIVGYDRDGFIVQNSWGKKWGYHGFAILAYQDWVQHGMDAWVTVLGAPVNPHALEAQSASRTAKSLRDIADGKASWSFFRSDDDKRPKYKNAEVEPWNEARAYRHTLVLGNDGRPLNRLLEVENVREAVDAVSLEWPATWLAENKSKKLAIYVHGGLNDEDASVERVRILAPYFEANGIYPLFVTWRTGLLESLVGMIEDGVKRLIFGPKAEGRLADLFESAKKKAKEAKDRSIEAACENLLVKAIWTQMKQNAAASQMVGAGGRRMADNIVKLVKDVRGLQVHLVGHSAGSIFLGHALGRLAARGVKVSSLNLFAPACTVAFANEHYGKAVRAGGISKSDIHMEILSGERELADTVGPYGKSLLYLVSRALEDVHKMPILGMEPAWDPKSIDPESDGWHEDTRKDVRDWIRFAGTKIDRVVHGKERSRVSDGQGRIPLAHGSFDNDVTVMTRTLARIAGVERLKFPIVSLKGF